MLPSKTTNILLHFNFLFNFCSQLIPREIIATQELSEISTWPNVAVQHAALVSFHHDSTPQKLLRQHHFQNLNFYFETERHYLSPKNINFQFYKKHSKHEKSLLFTTFPMRITHNLNFLYFL